MKYQHCGVVYVYEKKPKLKEEKIILIWLLNQHKMKNKCK